MSDPRLVLMAAGQGEMIGLALFILFLVIAALGQVLAKIHEARQVEEARRRGPIPRPGGARPAAPRAAGPLRQEVDDFVRDGARRPVAGRPPAAPPTRLPAPQPGRQPSAFPARRATEEPLEIGPAAVLPEAEDASVADHVRSHVPTQGFGGLVSDVGTGLTQTSDAMEGHVQDVFDHRLGTLGGTRGESAEGAQAAGSTAPEDRGLAVPSTGAAGLAAILAEPTSLRQAVLLNEILMRPEHRWET